MSQCSDSCDKRGLKRVKEDNRSQKSDSQIMFITGSDFISIVKSRSIMFLSIALKREK